MNKTAVILFMCCLMPAVSVDAHESDQEIIQKLEELNQRLDRIEEQIQGIGRQSFGPNIKFGQGTDMSSFPISTDWQVDKTLIIDDLDCVGTRLDKRFFKICYESSWRVSRWVAYYLDAENLKGVADRTNDFRPDTEIDEDYRSERKDYEGSGYDRGHMAPAAAFKRSIDAMSATFLLSNIAPQTPELNRRTWRLLEQSVRDVATIGASTWVVTGNVVSDLGARINGRVSIPSHCFKAILHIDDTGAVNAYGFLIPNRKVRLGDFRDYQITVDQLEGIAGLDFFEVLPDDLESKIESEMIKWPK